MRRCCFYPPDIDEARSAKESLTDAINTAQAGNHGNVVSARFELRQGRPEYLVRTFDSRSQQERGRYARGLAAQSWPMEPM